VYLNGLTISSLPGNHPDTNEHTLLSALYTSVLPFPYHQLPPPQWAEMAQQGECRPRLLTRPQRGHRFEPEVITTV
jgi:hypothetical protein